MTDATEMTERDRLFAEPRELLPDFSFDEAVADVFPDMIRRSVPGYGTVITLSGLLAARYAQPDSRIYDLGCSLGTTTLSVCRHLQAESCEVVGVDNSAAMLERCRSNIATGAAGAAVTLQCADIRDAGIDNASVVILNFTLQFIAPADRLPLLRRIHAGMRPGGVLILSEKLAFSAADEAGFQEQMHLDFKRANGYSELEISQKRTALENVMIPETLEAHEQRLAQAGFSPVYRWFQCFNFASLVAFK